MRDKKRTLFIYGMLLLFMALLNAVLLVTDLIGEEWNAIESEEDELVKKIVLILLVVVLAIQVFLIVSQVFLGVKGIRESRVPTKAKWHLRLSKFFAVVNVVLAVFCAIALFSSEDVWEDVRTLLTCVIDAYIMFAYRNCARAVQE